MSIERAVKQQIIDCACGLKSLPETAARLHALCNSHIADAPGLYKLISLDPVLFFQTQALFRYYYPQAEDSFAGLAKIIITLNINTVKNNVLRFASEKPGGAKKNEESFFSHSLAAALACRCIAARRGLGEDSFERYYAAGLLHDIGKQFPVNAEEHGEAGGIAAKAAGLSTDITDAIRYHHRIAAYRGSAADLVCSTALADFIAHSIAPRGGKPSVKLEDAVWEKLGITPAFSAEIKDEVQSGLAACEHFIKAGV